MTMQINSDAPVLEDQTAGKNKYEILDLPVDASARDIKSAYRKMALIYHPDRHPEDQHELAARIFHRISEAYQTLADPEKRARYDHALAEGLPYEDEPSGMADASLAQILADILKYEHIFDETGLGALDKDLAKILRDNLMKEAGERIVDVVPMSEPPTGSSYKGIFQSGAMVLTNLRAIFPFSSEETIENGNTKHTTRYFQAESMLMPAVQKVSLRLMTRRGNRYRVLFHTDRETLEFHPDQNNLTKLILMCDLWAIDLETHEKKSRGSELWIAVLRPFLYLIGLTIAVAIVVGIVSFCNDDAVFVNLSWFVSTEAVVGFCFLWALWSGFWVAHCLVIYDVKPIEGLLGELSGEA